MKKLMYGLIPVFCMVLSGCSMFGSKKSSKKKTTTTSEIDYEPDDGDPDTPDVAPNFITGISMKYTKDFFMQIGESLDFNVVFKGGGDDSQKGIRWTSSNPKVLTVSPKEKTHQCVLTALKEGKTNLVATSEYNPSLSAKVGISVIDNSGYTYIYQKNKDSKDENKFIDDEGNTPTDGTTELAGMSVSYHIDTPTIAVSGGQSLKFGDNKNGFGEIDLIFHNTRKVRKVSILCASTAKHIDNGTQYGTSEDHGSSKVSINIGNTEYVAPQFTPKNSNESDPELDTITGITDNTGSLSGDIKIHFTEAHTDDTDRNRGAIYFRSIIIEYYRGNLDHIEVDHFDNYFVGTKMSEQDSEVKAYFTESSEIGVVVTSDAKFETSGLSQSGEFVTPNPSQTVNVSYTYDFGGTSQTKTTSFTIHVYERLKSMALEGSLKKNAFLLYEKMDYDGLKINLYVDNGSQEPAFSYELKDYETEAFTNEFETSQIRYCVTSDMANGYTLSIKHKLTGVIGSKTLAKGDIVLREVSSIDIIYKDGETPYSATYKEGDEISYADFNAKINYTDSSSDTFKFSELNSQTYKTTPTQKTGTKRYNLSTTPLSAARALDSGFNITVLSTINNVQGTFQVSADQFDVVTISSITTHFSSFTKDDYEEFDEMKYDGITLDIAYSDGTSETGLTFAAATQKTVKIDELKDGVNKAVSKPLLTVEAPETASQEMANNGFNVKFTSIFDQTMVANVAVPANAITVRVYEPPVYTKITDSNDIVDGAKYIIIHILDNKSKAYIWNTALEKEAAVKANNKITYTHTSAIGETIQFTDKEIEKAAMTINVTGTVDGQVGSEKTYEFVRFDGLKLSTTSGGSSFSSQSVSPFKIRFTESENARLLSSPKSNPDQAQQIYYQEQYDTFKSYKIPKDNTDGLSGKYEAVQLYKVGADNNE